MSNGVKHTKIAGKGKKKYNKILKTEEAYRAFSHTVEAPATRG